MRRTAPRDPRTAGHRVPGDAIYAIAPSFLLRDRKSDARRPPHQARLVSRAALGLHEFPTPILQDRASQ